MKKIISIFLVLCISIVLLNVNVFAVHTTADCPDGTCPSEEVITLDENREAEFTVYYVPDGNGGYRQASEREITPRWSSILAVSVKIRDWYDGAVTVYYTYTSSMPNLTQVSATYTALSCDLLFPKTYLNKSITDTRLGAIVQFSSTAGRISVGDENCMQIGAKNIYVTTVQDGRVSLQSFSRAVRK